LLVPGGTYERTPNVGNKRPATIASFCLDKYEVTVGRFRRFLAAYDGWHGDEAHPALGEGAHPLVGETSGWDSSWTDALPGTEAVFTDADHLSRDDYRRTWRDAPEPGEAENLPINYVLGVRRQASGFRRKGLRSG
jgi:formylglycine-generating enzyme required for sulfatase activity